MAYELLEAKDYKDLPDHPSLKFLKLEGIARSEMERIMNFTNDGNELKELKLQYMSTASAIADECGVGGIYLPKLASPENGLNEFIRNVISARDRIQVRASSNQSEENNSVALSNRAKGRIRLQINKLRGAIESSGLAVRQVELLLARLDQLEAELDKKRLGFAQAMATVAYISTIVAANTSFLADAPQALTTIISIIGDEKAAEDDDDGEQLYLPAPPKVLLPPSV